MGIWLLSKDAIEYHWAQHRYRTIQKMDPTELAVSRLQPILSVCECPDTLDNVAFAKRLRRSLIDVPIDNNLNHILRMIRIIAQRLTISLKDAPSIVPDIISAWADQVLYIPFDVHYRFWTRLVTKRNEPYYERIILTCFSSAIAANSPYKTAWHDKLLKVVDKEDLAAAVHCASLFDKTPGKVMFFIQALYILIGLIHLEIKAVQHSYEDISVSLLASIGTYS